MSLFAALVLAQSANGLPIPPTFDKSQHVAELEAALVKQDYNQIAEVALAPKSAPEARASLDWLGTQFNQGASSMVALTYSRLLVAIASGQPGASGDGFRGTALAALIYAAASSSIEDRQCADGTAWGNRLLQMKPLVRQRGLLDLNEKTRRLAAAIALHVEKATWDRRKNNDDTPFLCMNGMRALSAGIATGAVREVEPAEGQIGRQMKVKVPDSFKYERRANAEWWPEAEALRARLPQLVFQLAEVDRLPTADELRSGPSE